MSYLLDAVYLLVIALASPWLVYRSIHTGKYREGWGAKFLGRVPVRTDDRTCIWLHAVSVGEVNLLAPLLAELDRRRPDCQCVISTTTRTGYSLARKKYADRVVFYCPLDFSWAVRAALRRIRPQLLVLAELELWPNLIRAARARGIPVAVVNGRLSERSLRGYLRVRPLVNRLLRSIDVLAVQNETYAARFRQLGAPERALCVTGSVKFDGAQSQRSNPATERLRRLAGIAEQDIVFLAGSTQEPEEAAALESFRRLSPAHPELRLILVPRHPERFAAVAALLDAAGIAWQRRSALPDEHFTTTSSPASRILLVDAVGELGAWWGLATIGFVGGSLGQRGGQNMIEPAAYGVAVSFGPNTANFRDVVTALLERDAAAVVADGDELTAFVRRCLDEPEFAASLGQRARQLVASQLGATRRTVERLETILPAVPVTASPVRKVA